MANTPFNYKDMQSWTSSYTPVSYAKPIDSQPLVQNAISQMMQKGVQQTMSKAIGKTAPKGGGVKVGGGGGASAIASVAGMVFDTLGNLPGKKGPNLNLIA
jgi:hypothetical protein